MAAACRRPRVVEGWFSLLERRCLACTVFFFFCQSTLLQLTFPFFFFWLSSFWFTHGKKKKSTRGVFLRCRRYPLRSRNGSKRQLDWKLGPHTAALFFPFSVFFFFKRRLAKVRERIESDAFPVLTKWVTPTVTCRSTTRKKESPNPDKEEQRYFVSFSLKLLCCIRSRKRTKPECMFWFGMIPRNMTQRFSKAASYALPFFGSGA